MTLAYHPEFAKVFEPMVQMMGTVPKRTAGDVEGFRTAFEGMVNMMNNQLDDFEVSQKIYRSPAEDGYRVPIYHFYSTNSNPDQASRSKTSAILYFHGGGMIVGSVPVMEKAIKAHVAATGIPWFAVDYRLAPENPHPTPVEDCFTGLTWLYEHADELNVDNTRIGLYGESAGGGLAAGVALLARDRGLEPPLAKQVLVYPMLDDRNTIPTSIADRAMWTYDDNITGWGALLGERRGGDDVDCYAAPARAESLKGLPSTYMDVGTLDIFRDENLKYVQRLVEDDVEVEFHLLPGLPHAFELVAPNIEVAKKAAEARYGAVASF